MKYATSSKVLDHSLPSMQQLTMKYDTSAKILFTYFFLRLGVLILRAFRGSNCSWDVLIFLIASLYRNVLLSWYLTVIAN